MFVARDSSIFPAASLSSSSLIKAFFDLNCPSKSTLWVLIWDSNSWIRELRVLILISYSWMFALTFTLAEGWDLTEEISVVSDAICLLRFSMILSLSARACALGTSFCHLTYLSLRREFYFSKARKALWSLINSSLEPWMSPKIDTGSWVLRFLTSTVKDPFNYSTPMKILLSSLVIDGLFSKFLVTIPSYLSKF